MDKYPKLKTLLMDNHIKKINYSNMVPDIVFLELKEKTKSIAIAEINRLRALPEVKDADPDVLLEITDSMRDIPASRPS